MYMYIYMYRYVHMYVYKYVYICFDIESARICVREITKKFRARTCVVPDFKLYLFYV